MSDMWNEIGEKVSNAFKDTSRSFKDDFSKVRNLSGVMASISDLDGPDLMHLLGEVRKIKARRDPKFPKINGDFYKIMDSLSAEDQYTVIKVRKFMRDEIAPIANTCWLKQEFPIEMIAKFKELDICGLTYDKKYGGQGKSYLLEGIIAQEIARVDVSFCTFYGVHSGLAMNSIYICGSEEQKNRFLPEMLRMDKIGAFALTEPDVGSSISFEMETTCEETEDGWVINGTKKWIGNASFADYIIVWAKDKADYKVKGFIVDRESQGLRTEVILDKMSLRTVQNCYVYLNNVIVLKERRLQNCNGFRDTALVLKSTRAAVAWQAVGCARGAYEATLKYTMERKQFGRPICGFQMTQALLSQMLAQLTAMQTMVTRLSQLQDIGEITDEEASLAKIFCTEGNRKIVSLSRELMGGNGILIKNNVARFLADAEALYSYEGTMQINSLIVGRAITGQSAFT